MECKKIESLFYDKSKVFIDLSDEFNSVIPNWMEQETIDLKFAQSIFQKYIENHCPKDKNPKDFDTQAESTKIMTIIKEILKNNEVRKVYISLVTENISHLFYDCNNQLIDISPELNTFVPDWMQTDSIEKKVKLQIIKSYSSRHPKKETKFQFAEAQFFRLVTNIVDNKTVRSAYAKIIIKKKTEGMTIELPLISQSEQDVTQHKFFYTSNIGEDLNIDTLQTMIITVSSQIKDLTRQRDGILLYLPYHSPYIDDKLANLNKEIENKKLLLKNLNYKLKKASEKENSIPTRK